MTSHRYRASTSEEQSAPQVNQRNLIMDDLRQQIQQLQQCLHLYENRGHDENEGFEDDGVDVNPFHQTHSHVSDDSTPPHPRDLRHYVLKDRETHRAFNAKVEIT